MTRIFHPQLALIASATDRELAKYVQFLKEENTILRSRVKGQVHPGVQHLPPEFFVRDRQNQIRSNE
jgi:hypothetical protein